MSNIEVNKPESRVGRWIVALLAIAIWFVLVSNSAKGQEIQVPTYVLAQVLGTVPDAPEPARPTRDATVTQVAHRMHEEFRDQLVAGVSRPHVELQVHFAWDSDEIEAQSVPEIEAAAEVLNRHFPTIRFRVAGYSDPSGDERYNQKLSERRAEAVWRSLVEEHGVAADRIERVGFGETDPDADAFEISDAERRRVELQILRAEQEVAPPS